MKVSIVMSCYNCQDAIGRTIDSIKKQTIKEFEVIIIDDCSTDNTLEYLLNLTKNDNRFKIIKNDKNIGLTKSLVKAINYVNGEYIARIDAGDLMDESRLKKQLIVLENESNIGLVSSYCDIIKIKDNNILERYTKKIEDNNLLEQMALSNKIEHTTVMFRKSVYDNVGGYNIKFYTSQDYELWIKIMQISEVKVIPEVLSTSIYNINNSITYNKNKIQLKNGIKIRSIAFKNKLLPRHKLLIGISKAIIMLILPNKINNLLRKKFSSVRVEAK